MLNKPAVPHAPRLKNNWLRIYLRLMDIYEVTLRVGRSRYIHKRAAKIVRACFVTFAVEMGTFIE